MTPAELFDQITAILYGYCDGPEVVIRVEMEFGRNPISPPRSGVRFERTDPFEET